MLRPLIATREARRQTATQISDMMDKPLVQDSVKTFQGAW
jgi:hypothetical protein